MWYLAPLLLHMLDGDCTLASPGVSLEVAGADSELSPIAPHTRPKLLDCKLNAHNNPVLLDSRLFKMAEPVEIGVCKLFLTMSFHHERE
jgi:hypothetical protein